MSDTRNDYYAVTRTPEIAGVDPSAVANAQADIPLAYQAGEGMGAVVWFSPIYDRKAVPVKTETPSKK